MTVVRRYVFNADPIFVRKDSKSVTNFGPWSYKYGTAWSLQKLLIPIPWSVIPDATGLIPYPTPLIPDPTYLVTTLSWNTRVINETGNIPSNYGVTWVVIFFAAWQGEINHLSFLSSHRTLSTLLTLECRNEPTTEHMMPRHESPSSSMVRASNQFSEGHGFDFRWLSK